MNYQPDLFTYGLTQCAECGDLIHQDEAVVRTYQDSTSDEQQEVFCSTLCHQYWYINRLRECGL